MGDYYRQEDWQDEQAKDPKFVEAQEEQKLSYQLTRLRLIRGLTQEELAERIDTRQSSISRLESGKQKPSIGFLEKVVDALDGVMELDVYPREEYEEYIESISHDEEETGEREFVIEVHNWPMRPQMNVNTVNESAEPM